MSSNGEPNPYYGSLIKMRWNVFACLTWNDDDKRAWTHDGFTKRNRDIDTMIAQLRSALNIYERNLGFFVKHERNNAGGHVHLLVTCKSKHVDSAAIVNAMRMFWKKGDCQIDIFDERQDGVRYVCKPINDYGMPIDYLNPTLVKMMTKQEAYFEVELSVLWQGLTRKEYSIPV